MTFLQIFNGRLVLMRAQRHLAQAHTVHAPLGSDWRQLFLSGAGREAMRIVESKLRELETEFDSKKRPRSQVARIRRQHA